MRKHASIQGAAKHRASLSGKPALPARALEYRYLPWIALSLVLLTLVPYWQVLRSEYVFFDDDGYVLQNSMVQQGVTRASLAWAVTATDQANWHPLTWLSHMLDCEIYGLRPWGHHLTNLLLHLANVALLLLLLKRATGSMGCSTFVAAVFAVHPLHVESVAWVAERKDVLSTFWGLSAIWCYIRYAEVPRIGRYIWVVLSFALSLMAKPMLITLPFVLLLLDYWPLGRLKADGTEAPNRAIHWKRLRRMLWEKTPLFTLATASSIVTYLAQKGSGAVASFQAFPFSIRLGNALLTYAAYLFKMFWPQGLAVFYPHPGFNLSLGGVLIASLVLVLVSLSVFRLRKRCPYLAVGWLWYLGTLVPVIGLVQVGPQAMADRYTYMPLIGIAIMVAWGISDSLSIGLGAGKPIGDRQRSLLRLGAGLVVLMLIGITWVQVSYWKNTSTLFEHALRVTQNNSLAHNNLGMYLEGKGELREAIAQFSEALRIQPDHLYALNNMGIALANLGNVDEAILRYEQALRISPDFPKAHYNLGIALGRQGRHDEAFRHFAEAVRRQPDFAEAHYNIALELELRRRWADAIVHCREALRIKPDFVEAWNNLGSLLSQEGKIEESIACYRNSLHWRSDQADVLNNLAWYLATSESEGIRNGAEAVRLASRACELKNNEDANFLGTLAAAFAEADRFDEAEQTGQKAAALALSAGQKEISQGLQEQLRLYKIRRPYRESASPMRR
jgi:tetratricopeptide (TPR) repeat protein